MSLNLPIMGKALFGTFLLGVPAILAWSFVKGSKAEFQMMMAAMVLIIFNVVFWTLFEQAGSSLTLFAARNTVLEIGWTAPLFAMFQATPITYYLFFAVVIGGVAWLGFWFFASGEQAETRRILAIGFAVVAVAGLIGMHVARLHGFGSEAVYVMPAGQTQIFNALFIVIFAPIFSVLWNALARRGLEPSIPIKFAIALMGVGAGFLFLVWGTPVRRRRLQGRHGMARRPLPDPLDRRALHLAGRPVDDHQIVDRPHRRHDDGRAGSCPSPSRNMSPARWRRWPASRPSAGR